MRKIIHIDMDAFYASVEQRDNPDLQGKPIAVGGNEKRGVTTTASYEARVFGVRSAMPGWQAKKLCPDLIFVPLRFEAYREASHQIRAIFKRYTDMIEPLSLDEAYLDVTNNKLGIDIATDIAKRIKEDIKRETNLTASAGVSYCKFLAKIASDYEKPSGLTVIKPHEALAFIEKLPIAKFYGVGKVTQTKMEKLGIFTGADLRNYNKLDLIKKFGKSGAFYHDIANGIDERPVVSDQIRKSYAVERTLENNLTDILQVHEYSEKIIDSLWAGIQKHNLKGRTLTLKVKSADFEVRTRSVTTPSYLIDKTVIRELFRKLIDQNIEICINIRLLGVSLSKFENQKVNESNIQLDLFS